MIDREECVATDAELVTGVKGGSNAAFEELVERYRCAVWSICLSYLRSSSDCEEVMQDIFIKAYLQLDRLRDPNAFGPWLAQIARRASLSALRTRSRYAAAVTRYAADQRLSHALKSDASRRAIEISDEARRAREAIHHLPARSREAVYLHFCAGYTIGESAQLLGITYAAMTKRLRYGLQGLQARLDEETTGAIATVQSDQSLSKRLGAVLPLLAVPWAKSRAATAESNGLSRRRMTRRPVLAALGAGLVAGSLWLLSVAMPMPQQEPGGIATPLADRVVETPGTPGPVTAAVSSPEFESAVAAETAPVGQGVIEGTVYDAGTGDAVAGVEITAYLGSRLYEVRHTGVTDGEGRYRIEGLLPEDYEVRRGDAHGFPAPIRDERQWVSLAGTAESLAVDFALERGMSVSGYVVDPEGRPLAGMRVQAQSQSGAPVREARTGEDGAFEVFGLASGPALLLSADGNGFMSELDGGFPFDGPLGDVALVAWPVATVEGRVADERGHGVAGAYVVARDRAGSFFADQRVRYVQSDGQGRYRLEGVGPGEISVFAQRSEPPVVDDPADHILSLYDGDRLRGVDLTLESGGAITIRVADGADNPVSGARVQWSGPSTGAGETDAAGRYVALGLREGEYTVTASHSGHAPDVAAHVNIGDETRLTLGSLGSVIGQVVDAATGKPVERFELIVTGNPMNALHDLVWRDAQTTYAADGQFRMDGLTIRPSRLIVRAPNYAVAVVDVTPSSDSRDSVAVPLTYGALLRGQVRADGAGVPHATVQVSQGTGVPFTAVTDSAGWFTVDGLHPGETAVYAALGSGNAVTAGAGRQTVTLQGLYEHAIIVDLPPAPTREARLIP